MWSITYPGQEPDALSVEGQGCECLNSLRADELRLIRPLLSLSQLAHRLEPRLVERLLL